MEGKYFIIEDGKVKITGMELPKQWDYESGGDPPERPAYINPDYYEALTQFKQSGIEVGNIEQVYQSIEGKDYWMGRTPKDGVYPCLSGTTFEVREECINGCNGKWGHGNGVVDCLSYEASYDKSRCENVKQTAFVTFNKI